MKWEKFGKIFEVNKQSEWLFSHSYLPLAHQINESHFRVYFSSRDRLCRSTVSFIDIDVNKPQILNNVSQSPVFVPGETDDFDDAGVWPNCILAINGNLYLYYTGWHILPNLGYETNCGIAKFDNKEGVFKRISNKPIFDSNVDNFFSMGVCYVMCVENRYRMWYEYQKSSDKDNFIIKYAESPDGINWNFDYDMIFKVEENESSFSRPCVLYINNRYYMWYSYKNREKYRIGLAESDDGLYWIRIDDTVGIYISKAGWDDEEIEYPFVFKYGNYLYMLYCGNGYGKTGFGIARCDVESIGV